MQDDTLKKELQKPSSKIATSVTQHLGGNKKARQPQPDMSLYFLFLSLKRLFILFFKPSKGTKTV